MMHNLMISLPILLLVALVTVSLRIWLEDRPFPKLARLVDVLTTGVFGGMWVILMSFFAIPDPYVQDSPISIFFMTLMLLLFAGLWHTEEFKLVATELNS